ncbi:MAG TPA: addiction module protein [Isosphaeraceae bacterium]|jgi:putative addiction module component (TIGR02574 family)|nr:addiction module protein [Isosphaeraceae bacterium]
MSETLEALKSRLEILPSRDRAELAEFLLDSLDAADADADADADAAWDDELTRRVAEIRAGGLAGKPADQVFDELRARFS